MTPVHPLKLCVTGLGVVSPRGDDPVTAAASPHDAREGWFDYRTELGRRGYKYLPTAAQYFLAACRRALPAEGGPADLAPAERGAAVGTNSGAEALHTAMDDTIVKSGADDLSPATAPFFSINLFGSRMAMEHAFQGFNLTLTSPRVAGFEAIQTGVRSLRLGRASWLMAGATEEALAPLDPGASASETGAVAMVLEPADRAVARGATELGRVEATSFFLPPRTAGSARGAERARQLLLRTALAPHGTHGPPEDVIAVLDASPVGEAVGAALGGRARRVPAGSGCLEPLLQTAGVLAGEGSRNAAVVTASALGNVAVCRITPPPDANATARHGLTNDEA